MTNIDELMEKATGEQRTVLSQLKGLVAEEKKLIEQTKKSQDKENSKRYSFPRPEPDDVFRPMTDKGAREHLSSDYSPNGRRYREIRGRIKKTTQEAKRQGVLVVSYNDL